MSRRFARLVVIIVSVFALAAGGCSSHRQLATQAVGFNLAVEKSQNEMLLLNVIRAKDRLPMYVTGISSMNGNFQTTLSSSVGASLSRAKGHVPAGLDTITRGVTPSATATLSTNPTFTLAVLDTQEFMRGFLAPVDKDTLAYYWDQGWRPELLLYLLVQRVEIEVKSPGQSPQAFVFENYPDSEQKVPNKLKDFGCWLHGFLAQKPRIAQAVVPESIGPPLSKDAVGDVAKLVQVAKEGMLLTKVADQDAYQLQRPRTDLRFTLDEPRQDALAWISSCGKESSLAPETLAEKPRNPKDLRQQYYQFLANAKGKMGVTQQGPATDTTVTFTFILRSPEALVYYLGELTRVANQSGSSRIPYICIQGRYQPLFVALPAGRCEDPLLATDSGRGSFAVPPALTAGTAGANLSCDEEHDAGEVRFEEVGCESGRSMQALRLLSQLMSLQKSAKDLPSTAVVRLIE